jgi:hypothetical protein
MYIKFATSIIKNATEKYMVAIPKNRISLIDIFPKSNLKKSPENPRINKILAIFDPITFPIIASVFGGLLNEANNVITSSGAEVPKATRVRPISIGEI